MTKLLNKYREIKKSRKGFTLVELLVVIAILAVLASVSVVGYLGFTEKARVSDDNTELHQIGTLVQAELIDGSENVEISCSESEHTHTDDKTTVYFVYADNTVSAYSDLANKTVDSDGKHILAAIKVMVNTEDSTMTEYITTATITKGQLEIKYKHHASTESVWTLGTKSE